VAKVFGDRHQWRTVSLMLADGGVPQVVEADAWEARRFEHLRK
jgi:hypothetical protein